MVNPFNPAPGAPPAQLVGREAELAAIREAVRRANLRSAPLPSVLIGQRGMGKTVLLGYLRRLAIRESLPVALETLPGYTLAMRLRDKIDALLTDVEPLPSRAAGGLRKMLDVIPKISYELPGDAGAIAIGGAAETENERKHDRDSLFAMLTALQEAARIAKRYVLITIDEVQDADAPSMQLLATFVHESAQTAQPILFAAAGLVETRDLLDKLRTYAQRWDTFDLRLLTLSESVEAIREPIVAAGVKIAEDALYALAHESGGYPFFIQAYSSAAWNAHDGDTIAMADVERSLPEVRRRNEMSFYVRPLAKLTPREMALALTLASLGDGAHSFGDVARILGRTARDISSARGTLTKKGIIGSPVPGVIEFRIPFTGRFLREHEDVYRTPEVRSALELLSRVAPARPE